MSSGPHPPRVIWKRATRWDTRPGGPRKWTPHTPYLPAGIWAEAVGLCTEERSKISKLVQQKLECTPNS